MLLNSGFDRSSLPMEPLAYNTVETLLEDVSKQMAASNLSRRNSRGAGGQRNTVGSSMAGAMRVMKTSSANNSPRNSSVLCRRKTVMTDSPYRRYPINADQSSSTNPLRDGNHEPQQTSQSSRPLSWHPSSYLAPQATQTTMYGMPTPNYNGMCDTYEATPAISMYSEYTPQYSPFASSTHQFTGYEHTEYPFLSDSSMISSTLECNSNIFAPYYPSTLRVQADADSFSTDTDSMDPTMYTQFDWNDFASNGFNNSTAPPTPENFLPIQHPDPSFGSEDNIPFNSLEDSEPAGEELVGMGLYDAPEKPPSSDPQLDSYRASMMTQLLGAAHRTYEPTGKGLKLEETWEPPASEDGEDDEEDGEGDEDEDADADAEESTLDEETEEAPKVPLTNNESMMYKYSIQSFADGSHFIPNEAQPAVYTEQYNRNGWL